METRQAIFQAKNITKSFSLPGKGYEVVLKKINLTIKENELVAFLGKSGAGKSTFLRIMAGLLPATLGEVYCNGRVVNEPSPNMSMVFQSFALMPWLTVFDNIAFGLEAGKAPRRKVEEKTAKMIKLIGLEGYEKAYPKELSGGMRQRVGFGRALVTEPELLLLDEPFSALDIFTAHKLRSDLISLWEDKLINTKSIVLVTHNVEEAIMMADRVIFMDSNPGRISYEFNMSIPRKLRTKLNTLELVEEISNKLNKQIAISEGIKAEDNQLRHLALSRN